MRIIVSLSVAAIDYFVAKSFAANPSFYLAGAAIILLAISIAVLMDDPKSVV